MSDRSLSRLWVPLSLLYVAFTIVGVVVALQTEGELIHFVQTVPGFTAVAVVGNVLVSRRPRNPIGWLLSGAGLLAAMYNATLELATYGAVAAPGSVPSPYMLGGLAQVWIVGFIVLIALSVCLFPTGSLPSHRWRRIVLGVGVISPLSTAVLLLGTAEVQLGPQLQRVTNPLFVPALAPFASVPPVLFLLSLSPLGVATASLVARYRGGATIEKQQLKWILLAAVLMVASTVVAAFPSPISGAFNFVSLLVLPAGIGIAILRYRLFDIDHLINRTLVYGVTSGVIAILFFAGIVALQPVLRPLTAGSDLAVAASTLVAFALFQPIRRRVQSGVDRRFDRSRYDAARTLDTFSEELRDEVDLARVEADLLGAVSTTMAPQHISLWLRDAVLGWEASP
jgi:hypothetical protein